MNTNQCNEEARNAKTAINHERWHETALLEKMARVGTGSWNLSHAFELMTAEIGKVVKHDAAILFSYNAERRILIVDAIAPAGAARLVRGTQIPADGAVMELAHGNLAAAVCMDTRTSCCTLENDLSEIGLHSCITVPLRCKNGLEGLLTLCRHGRHGFRADASINLCQLQQPLSVVIEHVRKREGNDKLPQFFDRSTELERMRSIRELSSSIAHRLNNVFAAVVGNARLAMECVPDPKARRYLENLYEQGLEGARVVHAMQQFAATEAPTNASKVDLHVVTEGVLQITDGLWRHQVEARRIHLIWAHDREEACSALSNAAELREATVNLVFNSIQALPDGGTIWLSAANSAPWALIEVRDDGCGMDDETVRRCTEPFFTTRPNAYGLGLSIAAGVARKYGGHLEVNSQLGYGTAVRIMLPSANHGV